MVEEQAPPPQGVHLGVEEGADWVGAPALPAWQAQGYVPIPRRGKHAGGRSQPEATSEGLSFAVSEAA